LSTNVLLVADVVRSCLKLGCTELSFVEPRVKVDGRYYREVLLKQQMLPVMRRIAGDMYVFQQDSACTGAPRSRDSSVAAAGDNTVHLSRSVAS